MRIDVDSGAVLLAATHLRTRGSLVAGRVRDCDRIPDGLSDPALTSGVADLADVAADVLELVAADLALLATRTQTGAVLYDRVEERVRDGMRRP